MFFCHRAILCLLSLSTVGLAGPREERNGYSFESIMLEMSDGTSLSTDLYLPKGEGQFPAVLIRTPYNKSQPFGRTVGERFIEKNIAVIMQDCRGRHDSEGEFYPFKNERQDGLDTLKWLRALPWHNGKIGGALGSYNGYTQLAISDELDVVLDIISCANMHDLAYPGGLYSLETSHKWAFKMDVQESDGLSEDAIEQSYWTLPLKEAATQAYGRKNPFIEDCLQHEKYDAYWKKTDHRPRSTAVTFSCAGWYDIFLMGQIADFEGLRPPVKSKSRLVIGPWAHGQPGLENDFGGKMTATDLDDFSFKLLADFLTDKDPGERFVDPLFDAQYNLFIMERNEFFPSDVWPPRASRPTDYYLTKHGSLSTRPAAESGRLEYLYNPADPYPSKGGTVLGTPAGQADQRANETRTDQLVFNLPITTDPLTLLGPINARLFVETDAVSTDFMVLVQDVFPDGTVVNIQEGGAEYVPGKDQVGRLEFSVWATGYQLNPGHTLRVVVTSSWFPRFNRNLNRGDPIYSAQQMQKAQQRVFFGREHPSAIILPLLFEQKN